MSWKARTKWSDEAFEAEYGLCGSYGVSSRKRSVPNERAP